MFAIDGYSALEPLHRGGRSFVLRATRDTDGQRVVIKTPSAGFPSSNDLRRLRHEFALGQAALLGPARRHVVRHLALDPVGSSLALVLEDFGARSLHDQLGGGGLPLTAFLNLALSLTRAVQALHEASLVHLDINPSNVLVNPETRELRLCDLSAAVKLSGDVAERPPLIGTPAYAAPEQSQRTGWAVDYRSDLYSLGATLFELLTGRQAFAGKDALETLHRHLAVAPPSVRELRSDVPPALAALLLKLLSKNPDERYRSAAGLYADLLRCQAELESSGTVAAFEPGREDQSPLFAVPARLYGREAELGALCRAFERAGDGEGVFVLLSGEPGVGKSALVAALGEHVRQRKGHFCSGKFEPLRENQPYGAFSAALRALLRSVLARPAAELWRWRERLSSALGQNAQLLVRLVPELERLIGPQPDVAELPPEQAQARFRYVLLSLLDAITSPEQPLTIFLDDVQWADRASLSLIEQLLGDERKRHLLLICAYREGELRGIQPLLDAVQRLGKKARLLELALAPLELGEVEKLVADSMLESIERCRPLSLAVWKKTRGNPFFVGQFLKMLHAERLLWFDPAERRFRHDLQGCEAQDITDNVIDLMVRRIHRLGRRSQQVLRQASCIGSKFAVETLAAVLGGDSAEITEALADAVSEELIAPLASPELGAASQTRARFRFLHDHVQQAAYALIPEAERPALHLSIGRALLLATPEAELEGRIFQLLDHLSQGLSLVLDDNERQRIAELCLIGGRRAKAANAYDAATKYLRSGLELVGERGWQDQYELCMALHREHAEASYLNAEFEEMSKSSSAIMQRARTLLDKIPAYQLELTAHVARNELPRAIAVAREALGQLGAPLPLRPSQASVGLKVARMAWRMRGETPESLLARPRTSDPRVLAAAQILALVATPAYLTSPKLFPLVICEILNLTLSHGNSEWSSDAFLGWGAIQIAGFGALERGHAVGTCAPRLIDLLSAGRRRGRTHCIYNLLIRHWLEPLRSTVEPLRGAVQDAVEHGDLSNASVAAVTHGYYMLHAGFPLAEVEEAALSHQKLLGRLGHERFSGDARRILQLVHCLQGRAAEPKRLRGELFDEEEALGKALADGDRAAIASLSYERALLLHLYGDSEAALDCCTQCERHLDSVLGTVYPPALAFLSALVRLRLLGSKRSERTRSRELASVRRNLKQLSRWSASAPANQAHRVHLVQAELARVLGDSARASREYERAIELAGRNGYLHEQAMALECAARFYSGNGQQRLAVTTISSACAAWSGWGAQAKAAELRREFAGLLAAETPERLLMPARGTHSAEGTGLALDVASMLKASQAIVGEIRLPNLVRRLLGLAMENTGAQRGVLLLNSQGQLRIEAAADVDEGDAYGSAGALRVKAELGDVLPRSIVDYVARVSEPLVSADTSADPLFSHDPYVARHKPLSVLCVPLISQGLLSGIVYLENNRMRGAFSADRVELLRLLSALAAISLENARLYEDVARAHALEVQLSEAQARFVPVEFLRSLDRQSIVDVALGDNIRKEMSVLFSDVRGFTSLVESMSPEQHIGFINGYLGQMEPAIVDHGGFVDSYLGDGIMALFEGDADNSVRAAVEMSAALQRFNRERQAASLAPVQMGVGISSGPLTLGTIGGPMRIKCGVIGDPVNLASRIESLTKHFGCFLLISHHTKALLRTEQRFELRLVDRVRVKGKAEPVTLFEVLDAEPERRADAKRRSLRRFEEAMAGYAAGDFAAAARLFESCLELCPDDGAAASLANRARGHLRAPRSNWDGVETLTEK